MSDDIPIEDLIKKYVEIRTYVDGQEAELKRALEPYKTALGALNDALTQRFHTSGVSSVKVDNVTAYAVTVRQYRVMDPLAFTDWVMAGHIECVKISPIVSAMPDELPPGLALNRRTHINIRRA